MPCNTTWKTWPHHNTTNSKFYCRHYTRWQVTFTGHSTYPHPVIRSPHCVPWFVAPHNIFTLFNHPIFKLLTAREKSFGIHLGDVWLMNSHSTMKSKFSHLPPVIVLRVDPDTVWNSCVMIRIDVCLLQITTLFNGWQSTDEVGLYAVVLYVFHHVSISPSQQKLWP